MKTFFKLAFVGLLFITAFSANAQVVKSPAKVLNAKVLDTDITINYNAPSVRDRDIWGGLVAYDKIWRTGANGATKITVDKDIQIEGQTLAAGTYAIFTIPSEKTWTIIFNTDSEQWGAYDYNKEKDVLRLQVSPVKMDHKTEQMTFVKADDSTIHLIWDELAVPINFGPAH